jgi:hypothetical protein
MKSTRMTRIGTVTWALIAVSLGVTGAALAHEGHEHHQAMGTVQAVDASKLELKGTEGTDWSFVLSEETTFRRGATDVDREDVAVGERAVVTYETEEGVDRALEVRLAEKRSSN